MMNNDTAPALTEATVCSLVNVVMRSGMACWWVGQCGNPLRFDRDSLVSSPKGQVQTIEEWHAQGFDAFRGA